MRGKIFLFSLALILGLSLIGIVSADTVITTGIVSSGTTTYSSRSTGNFGELNISFNNVGTSVFGTAQKVSATDFEAGIATAALGTGTFSATTKPVMSYTGLLVVDNSIKLFKPVTYSWTKGIAGAGVIK